MEIISHRRVDISSSKQDSNFIYSFIYILKQGEFKISKFSLLLRIFIETDQDEKFSSLRQFL